jgi:hypothetical protein
MRNRAQKTPSEIAIIIPRSRTVMPRMLPNSAASMLRVNLRYVETIATPRAKLEVVTTPIAASAPTQ